MKIDSYRFGEIVIGGKKYTEDVIILPGRVISWWRKRGHTVEVSDLNEAAGAEPEILIIGTGAYGAVRVLPEVNDFLSLKGIKLTVLPSPQACERYNRLSTQHRIVAALHLTC
ncbi:MAG: MTH938/NDUFAF3 family protein [Bacillota bacterium]